MIKKISLNVLILFFTYFLPLYLSNLFKDNFDVLKSIQVQIHVAIFIGAGLLTYLNYVFIKQTLNKKWVWFVFEMIGIIGLIYSAGILFILYEFRHGIGF